MCELIVNLQTVTVPLEIINGKWWIICAQIIYIEKSLNFFSACRGKNASEESSRHMWIKGL